jgi:hypothetical protein
MFELAHGAAVTGGGQPPLDLVGRSVPVRSSSPPAGEAAHNEQASHTSYSI